MSRRRAAEKRDVLPDPKYGDRMLTKFTNSLMMAGKKSAAEKIIYGALDIMEGKTGQDPVKREPDEIKRERIGRRRPAPLPPRSQQRRRPVRYAYNKRR